MNYNPQNFIELLSNPYFYGPIVGMAGLFIAGRWMQYLSAKRNEL